MMKLVQFENAKNLLAAAREYLCQKEAEYNLILGFSELQAKNENQIDPNQYFAVYQDSVLLGVALLSPLNLILTSMPQKVLGYLAEQLFAKKLKVKAVLGPDQSSINFAQLWKQISGLEYKNGMFQLIYQLDTLKQIDLPKGHFQLADESHIPLVGKWWKDFADEAIPQDEVTMDKALAGAERIVKSKSLYLWFNEHHQPVSMCGAVRRTVYGVVIALVYTPTEFRKKGYGSAVTFETSRTLLKSGYQFCALYTDEKNPTSNKIYQDMGYRQIATSKQYIFET